MCADGTSVKFRHLASVIAALAVLLPVPPAMAAKRTTTDGPTLRVATYNVCKTTCKGGKWSWANRRGKVANILTALSADVIATQETPTLPYNGTTQWADLASLLRSRGLRIASMQDGCTQGCTRDSHIYYNPATVEVVRGLLGPTDDPAPPDACMRYWDNRDDIYPRRRDPWYRDWYANSCSRYMAWEPQEERSTGMVSQEEMSGVDWGGIQDRNLSWAFMRHIATGKVFLMLSLHLPNEKTATGEQARRAVAGNLPAWAAALSSSLGLPDIPVVVGGDLNSYKERQPSGAQAILGDAGYSDGFAAGERVNERYATINKNGVINSRFGGWPAKPYKYNRPGTRIDYVFAKGVTPVRYELFLRLRGDAFDERYRASDHNPVVTTWALPT